MGNRLSVPGDLTSYRGRFAPSPTGALHAGSLVAALASWLDARAHQGQWLVRIEDIDTTRCQPGVSQTILSQLHACGFTSDAPVLFQSHRGAAYQAALDRLVAQGLAYPCACTRKEIEESALRMRHQAAVYPGTCRHGLKGKPARAWRLNVGQVRQNSQVQWHDRRLGQQSQDVPQEVGDFVLKRADGLWAYQLAVVVDDAAQDITHVVRGQDLADNTARQWLLQEALGLPHPLYLHAPLVLGKDGEKLSKQNGATALSLHNTQAVHAALNAAARVLGLSQLSTEALTDPALLSRDGLAQFSAHWGKEWQALYGKP
jgi:glutamyl-Q tRNA(Asp) synthetase